MKSELATKFYADTELGSSDFEPESLEVFERLLDFCASDAWFTA